MTGFSAPTGAPLCDQIVTNPSQADENGSLSRCCIGDRVIGTDMSAEREYWIWPVFRDGNRPLQVASRMRLRRSGKQARPYICRLIILMIRLTFAFDYAGAPGQGEPWVSPLRTAS